MLTKVQDKGGVVLLKLPDELTIYTAAELKQQLFSYWEGAKELEVISLQYAKSIVLVFKS